MKRILQFLTLFSVVWTLLFSLKVANGQTWEETNGPFGGPVNCFGENNSYLFAGTSGGVFAKGIFRSADHGATWSNANTGLSSASNGKDIVAFTSSGGKMIVSTAQGIYYSVNNGDTWSVSSYGGQYYPTNFLTVDTILYCVGSSGLYVSLDYGMTWTPQNDSFEGIVAPALPEIRSIVLNDTIMYVGTYHKGIFRSFDKGLTWTTVNGGLGTALQLNSRSFNHLGISGTDIFVGTSGQGVFRLINNGTTWTQEVVGLPTGFARSPSSMLVKNDSVYISSNAGIYATVSSGTISWNLINTNPSGLVFTKLFASGSDIFAITTKGVYKSGDNTANWVPSHDEMRGLITTKIYSAGGTDLFATTLWGVGDGYFYRSSDFGNTWVMGNKIGSPYLFNNFLFIYQNDGIYRSADNGETWQWIYDFGTLSYFYSMGNTLFVRITCCESIFYSTDNGDTWTPCTLLDLGGFTSNNITILSLANDGTNIYAGTLAHGVLKSVDNGVNWTACNLAGSVPIRAMATNGTYVYAGTSNYYDDPNIQPTGIYRSADFGATWELVNSGLNNLDVGAIEFNGTDLYAGTEGGVYKSSNNGNSWTAYNEGFSPIPNPTSLAVSGNYIFTNNFTTSIGSPVFRRALSGDVPVQPSAISGLSAPCSATTQSYSVDSIAGVAYAWQFPSDWAITSGDGTHSVSVTAGTTSGLVLVTPSNGWGNGPFQFLTVNPIPSNVAQPGAISGETGPIEGASYGYSVANQAGVTFTWTFPAGWTQTAGGSTNSVTVTAGASSGAISVAPSTTCGSNTASTLTVTPVLLSTLKPAAFDITGGGSYCGGSTGIEVGLSGTETGVDYRLYKNDTSLISTLAGTGSGISFGLQMQGTYKVIGENTYGTSSMNGTATISEIALATPSVSISADNTGVCSGIPVTLTATPLNGGTPSYQWYLNGSVTGTNNHQLSYTPTDGDSVYVVMTSDLSCTTTNPVQSNKIGFSVADVVAASVTISADNTEVCSGTEVTLTATPVNGGVPSYQWYINGTASGTGTEVFSYIPSDGDQVKVVMASSLACTSNSPATSNILAMQVTQIPSPTVSVAASSNPVCSGTGVTLTATPVDGGTPVYQWYLNGSAVGTGAGTYSYAPAEGDEVYVSMVSNLACAGTNPVQSNAVTIGLTDSFTASVSVVADNNPYCAGGQVKLTATPGNGGAASYEWFLNGSPVGLDTNIYVYTPTNGDVIYARITSDLACAIGNPATSNSITLNEVSLNPVSVSIAADDTSVCSGTQVNFTATPVNGGNAGYQWFVNGTAAGTDSPAFSYAPQDGDKIHVMLTSSLACTNGNPAQSDTLSVSVGEVLPVSVGISADNTSVCIGTQVTFTATPVNGGIPSYQWFVNGVAAGADSPEFVYTPADGDMVHVVATSSLACTSGNPAHSDTIQVSVGEVMPVSVSISADNTAVCSGTEVNFTAVPINGGTPSYQWFVNGVVAGSDSPAFSYAPQDGDKVHVRLTSGIACTSGNPAQSDTIPVSVGEVLPVSVSIAADNTSVCSGTPVTFTATPVNGGSPSYQWSVNGSAIGSSSQNFIYTPINGDVVNVEMTSDLNCTTNNPALSNTIVPEVIELLPVSVTIDADTNMVCSGTEVTLVATPVNGGEPAYQWNVNGKLAGYNMTTYTYAPVDGDEVYVQMISSLSCTSNNPAQSNTETFTVKSAVHVSVSQSVDHNWVCEGTPVTFTAESVNGGNAIYKWLVNGVESGSNAQTFTYTPANEDKVNVELTSDLECTIGNPALSNTIMLKVDEILPVSVSVIAYDSTLCEGEVAILTADPVNGGGIPAFEWYINDSLIMGDLYHYYYYPKNGDQIKVKMASSLTCVSGNPAVSEPLVLTVFDNPEVTWETSGDTVFCINGGEVLLNGGFPEGGIYSGAGVSEGTFSPSVAGIGTHELVYSFSTEFGCNGEAIVTVSVDSCTSIPSARLEDMVDVYPNPASDVLYVAINGEDVVKAVRLVSLLGNTVMEVKTAPAERMVELPLNGLNHTLYFVEIIFEDGMLIKQVVVK